MIEFAKALCKVQEEIKHAKKDASNPHFRTQYATLSSVWEACKGPLTDNGFSVIQHPTAEGAQVTVETILLHCSGEQISSKLTMTAQKNTPQGIGSCITYCRRYALSAIVGVCPDDDDANEASTGPQNQNRNQARPAANQQKQQPQRQAQTRPVQAKDVINFDLNNEKHRHYFNEAARTAGLITEMIDHAIKQMDGLPFTKDQLQKCFEFGQERFEKSKL